MPETYRQAIEQQLRGSALDHRDSAVKDLKQLGILELNAFDIHKEILDINPDELLPSILTKEELTLWRYLAQNKGRLIGKDEVTHILRPGNNNYVSLWAIDKAISRFRKKLASAGLDPDYLKTSKGKGYIMGWIGTQNWEKAFEIVTKSYPATDRCH